MQRATAARAAATHAGCLYVIRDNWTGREENGLVFFSPLAMIERNVYKIRPAVSYMLVLADISRISNGEGIYISPLDV